MEYKKIEKIELTKLMFAYDMAIIADTDRNLQHNVGVLDQELRKIYMKINIDKIKGMMIFKT